MSAKFTADSDEVVEIDPLWLLLLAPKLFVRLRADSSLLPPLAGTINGGPLLLGCAFSCGGWFEPIGVATLSFGGCFFGISRGGSAEASVTGGAAELLIGL